MRTYRFFKTIDNYKCEDYLHQVTNTRHRIALTKLRLTNHKLAIGTGRYPRPFKKPAGRICPICKIDNNFIDFIFDKKISVSKQSIQWQMKQRKKLSKKERNNNYILNIIIKEKIFTLNRRRHWPKCVGRVSGRFCFTGASYRAQSAQRPISA